MSPVSNSRMRPRALTIAIAAVFSSLAMPAVAGRVELSGLRSAETTDQFIVGYRAGSSERRDIAKAKQALTHSERVGGKALGLRHLRRMGIGADVVRVDRKLDRVEAEALMRQIAADPDVEYVTVDQRMFPVMTPNDTYYSVQWGYSGPWGIRAEQAWDITQGAGVVVAVIDTGITNHSDLNANVLPGYDFITDAAAAGDGNGRDNDPSDEGDWVIADQCYQGSLAHNSSWHGTHVSGTIAALTNNAKGVAGVAHAAKVVPVRVLGKCGGMTSDIVDAILWASGGDVQGVPTNPNPAEVINMSLGGASTCSTPWQNAIDSAVKRGTIVVVAAGNDDADASGHTPAGCNNVITVGATDDTGANASFSNWGSPVDVAAPGVKIGSTLNTGTTIPATEAYYYNAGTSMSAPHVAGVAALIQSIAPKPKTPAQVEDLIKCTAKPFPPRTQSPWKTLGTGVVNAEKAALVAEANFASVASGIAPVATLTQSTVITRPLSLTGPGNASCSTQISISINHPNPGNLQFDLYAPSGTAYPLTGGSLVATRGGGWVQTYTVNMSDESQSGTWSLGISDNSAGTVGSSLGFVTGWSMTFN